jgi:hypothetical protein
LQNAVKGDVYVYTPLLLLTYHASTPRDIATISKMGHTIVMGMPMFRV